MIRRRISNQRVTGDSDSKWREVSSQFYNKSKPLAFWEALCHVLKIHMQPRHGTCLQVTYTSNGNWICPKKIHVGKLQSEPCKVVQTEFAGERAGVDTQKLILAATMNGNRSLRGPWGIKISFLNSSKAHFYLSFKMAGKESHSLALLTSPSLAPRQEEWAVTDSTSSSTIWISMGGGGMSSIHSHIFAPQPGKPPSSHLYVF